jgi:hypothetical protein
LRDGVSEAEFRDGTLSVAGPLSLSGIKGYLVPKVHI